MHRSLNANPWENYFLPSEFGAKYQNDVKFVCQGEGTKLPNSIIRPQDWRERPFRRGEALQPPQCNAADRTKAVKAACRESQNEWLMSFGPPTTRERERERERVALPEDGRQTNGKLQAGNNLAFTFRERRRIICTRGRRNINIRRLSCSTRHCTIA